MIKRLSMRGAVFAAVILFFCGGEAAAKIWTKTGGDTFDADPIQFDYKTKTVTFFNNETKSREDLPAAELDYRSKRRLLLSPVFHSSYPKGGLWPKEKIKLFALVIFSPIALLVVGMWLAALFTAKRFNPFSAVGAFLGSWIAGVILVVCYLIYAAKSGMGAGLIWVGAGVAALVMALFISSIYNTTYVKGIIIFVGHILMAGLLAFLLLIGTDTLLPREEVSAFWEHWVFAPVGLIEEPSPVRGY